MQFGCNQLNMLVDLGIEILERFVKDGVKEMMSEIAGGSRAKKQKHWFIAMKTAISISRKSRKTYCLF